MSEIAENVVLKRAMTSIVKNTCCDGCQEAALVAQAALREIQRIADGDEASISIALAALTEKDKDDGR